MRISDWSSDVYSSDLYNREAALGLTIVSKFTYTLESLIQAGKGLVAISHVPVGTNEKLRESRLFGSMGTYVRRNIVAILRLYTAYEQLRVFNWLALLTRVAALARLSQLLWGWAFQGDRSGQLPTRCTGGGRIRKPAT